MLFDSRKPVLFDDRRRRSGRRLPRWLLLLLCGLGVGVGGVFYLQERVLPPRLGMDASARLQDNLDRAEAERQRLATELAQATNQLQTLQGDKKTLSAELASTCTLAERLRDDLASVVAALPPDPRNGAVEVRAARFSAGGGMLSYDVVLSREHGNAAKPMPGVLQLVVTGNLPQRPETSVALKPIALSMGRHEVLRGSLTLPAGFRPQQATVQVLDKPSGRLLGMRMLQVRQAS